MILLLISVIRMAFFFEAAQKDGVSVNISDPAVKSLHGRGMETVMADIEFLPFKDNSIHTIFLFETLEHVPNPITLLDEISRVCSDTLIVSIPFVEKTKIHPYNYDPTVLYISIISLNLTGMTFCNNYPHTLYFKV